MAVYNGINYKDKNQVTQNFKFILMGNNYQHSNIIYRANMEKMAVILDSLIQESLIVSPSKEKNKIKEVSVISTEDYIELEKETGSKRALYFIKGEENE